MLFNQLIQMLMGEALNLIGGSILLHKDCNAVSFKFRDREAFKKFSETFLPVKCGQEADNLEQPLKLQMSIESKAELEDLKQMIIKGFNRIGIPHRDFKGTGVFEAHFPNEEAYFAMLLNFFQSVMP